MSNSKSLIQLDIERKVNKSDFKLLNILNLLSFIQKTEQEILIQELESLKSGRVIL